MFVYSEFQLEKRGDKCFLRTARPLFTTLKAGSDIATIALASYFAELCEDAAPDAESARIVLPLLMNVLYLLAKNDRPKSWIKAVFELRLLVATGFMPLTSTCAVCGKEEESAAYFRLNQGDLVCRECLSSRDENAMLLSRDSIALIRRTVAVPEKDAYAVKVHEKTLKEFSRFCERYLLAQLERNYKTLEFYKGVRKLDS